MGNCMNRQQIEHHVSRETSISEYEDVITLEPIPHKDIYLLKRRYYDIKSLYKYITTASFLYIPHTMEPMDDNIISNIKKHYQTLYPAQIKHQHQHQRFYVRPIQKHTYIYGDQYFIPDEPLPVGTLFYDRRDGHVRCFRCEKAYNPGDMIFYLQPAAYTSLHFPIPASPHTVLTSDILGYSLPCDQ